MSNLQEHVVSLELAKQLFTLDINRSILSQCSVLNAKKKRI